MHYELNHGRSGYRRRAFRYIFARFILVSLPKLVPQKIPFPSPKTVSLAKDAAPIPNALAATNTKALLIAHSSQPRA